MSRKVLDIAWARPSVAQIKATGAEGVARYLSNDIAKNLRESEVVAYRAAGLTTVVVWETTAARALAGMAAGQSDARSALAQAKAVGLPADMTIHFAVDVDTTWSQVLPYFRGVHSVMPMAWIGVYGGERVIAGAYAWGVRKLWQTRAWSAGVIDAHATLYQRGSALGGQADVNDVCADDYGQYPRPAAPGPAPSPAPTPEVPEVITDADLDRIADRVLTRTWKLDVGAAGLTAETPFPKPKDSEVSLQLVAEYGTSVARGEDRKALADAVAVLKAELDAVTATLAQVLAKLP
jgi:hypothetical protein